MSAPKEIPLVEGRIMGHKVECFGGLDWRYKDTGLPYVENSRSCTICSRFAGDDGHDPCIANLEGVKNACCGHGFIDDAYIQFHDGRGTIRGEDALTEFRSRNAGP